VCLARARDRRRRASVHRRARRRGSAVGNAACHRRVGEPAVKRTVIEDKGATIEELRVRGNLQKVVVKPRGPAPAYEVLTSDGYHPTADDPGTSHGSAGKRVWSVLRF